MISTRVSFFPLTIVDHKVFMAEQLVKLFCVLALAAKFIEATGFTNEDNCGIATISRSSQLGRIVNGAESTRGQWPWQAMITTLRGSVLSFVCGGTLINNRWVVTAAHCFVSGDSEANVFVYLGVHQKSNIAQGIRLAIENMTCHETYGGAAETFKDDICLLKFTSDVTYTDYIRPACLPSSGTSIAADTSCVISGWGATENTGSDDILRYAQVPIVARSTCTSWYQEEGTTIPDDHLCAGYENGGIDSCQGDSGGPLTCPEAISGASAYVLRGITSFGSGCADARRPGVYTNVSVYVDWINQTIAQSSGDMPLPNIIATTLVMTLVVAFGVL